MLQSGFPQLEHSTGRDCRPERSRESWSGRFPAVRLHRGGGRCRYVFLRLPGFRHHRHGQYVRLRRCVTHWTICLITKLLTTSRRGGSESETDNPTGHLPLPTHRFCGLLRNGGGAHSHLALLSPSMMTTQKEKKIKSIQLKNIYHQDLDTPIPYAFQQLGWPVARWVVSIGTLFGLSTRYAHQNIFV